MNKTTAFCNFFKSKINASLKHIVDAYQPVSKEEREKKRGRERVHTRTWSDMALFIDVHCWGSIASPSSVLWVRIVTVPLSFVLLTPISTRLGTRSVARPTVPGTPSTVHWRKKNSFKEWAKIFKIFKRYFVCHTQVCSQGVYLLAIRHYMYQNTEIMFQSCFESFTINIESINITK